jgi:transcription elongation GreA/GreB family factor
VRSEIRAGIRRFAHTTGLSCCAAEVGGSVSDESGQSRRIEHMNQHDDQSVTVGSWVKVKEDGDDEVEVYRIASHTNLRQNAISADNAMGQALLGAKPGDEVTVSGRSNPIKLKVLEVGRD